MPTPTPDVPTALPALDWSGLFDQAGLLAVLVGRDGRVVHANPAFVQFTGRAGGELRLADLGLAPATAAAEAGGTPGGGADPWDPARPLPPPVEAAWAGDPAGRWIRWKVARVPDAAGAVGALALLGTDVTGRRQAEWRIRRTSHFYRALSDMGQAMLRLDQPAALYDAICRIAVDSGGAVMAWIGLVADGQLTPDAWAGGAERYTEGLGLRLDAPDLPEAPLGPSAWAVRHGRPFVCNDILAEPRTRPWRDRTTRFGVRSCAAMPFQRGGTIAGTLNLYFADPGAFDDEVVALLLQLVSDLGYALEHIDRAAARLRAEQAARERDRQLAGIVDCAMDAIVALDRRLRVVLFNDAAARMFGVRREDALGGSLDRFLPPELRTAHAGWLAHYLEGGEPARRMGGSRQLVGLRADGERFPMEASISRTGEGDRLLLTMMARDVTRLREAEKAQLAQARAEAANRAKTGFLSRISHELRTPLNAVLGFARLMAADVEAPLPASQRQRLERVLLAGEHLRTLMEEVLDVASIEAGRLVMEVRDFDLRELVGGVVALCETAAHERGVQVTLRAGAGAGGPLPMRGDAGRLRQVLLNLLTNAIKYNRRGGHVEVQLRVTGRPAPDRPGPVGEVDLVVRDDGLGMDEAQRAQLFQPFNRLGREGGEVPGMGIGLVLVRELVARMGGTITIDSDAGVGTTARVTLPGVPPAEPPAPAAFPEAEPPREATPPPVADARGGTQAAWPGSTAASATATAAPAASAPRGRVLYVEDNAINALLVEQLLARWPGVSLAVCTDAASGLARAREWRPSVILLDMQLPDLDGLEVLRRLKADPATRDVPVVAVSADALPEGIRDARAAGAVDYWTKPLDFDLFLGGLRRLLPR